MACDPLSEAGPSSDAYFRKVLRRQWRSAWVLGGRLTCDVWRYTQGAAGNPSAGIPPGYSLDSGLTGLPVTVNKQGRYTGRGRDQSFVAFREGQQEFGFCDLPTSGGVAAGIIQLTDVVSWGGRVWRADPQAQDDLVRNDVGVRSYLVAEKWGLLP